MKQLDFGPNNHDAKEFYEILYDGALQSPRGYTAPTETRMIGKFLDKMEAIGRICKRGNDVSYELNGGGLVILDEEIHRLVSDALKLVKWNGVGARKATKAIDWFDQAPVQMDENGVAAK